VTERTDVLDRFRRDYTPLLLRYLAQQDEAGLRSAYELGRDALRDSVGLLDLVRVHHELFLEVLTTVRDADEARDVARASSVLLLDLLASFEMTQRALRDAHLVTHGPAGRSPSRAPRQESDSGCSG